MDNIIQAHEIIHTLKSKKKVRMLIRLDLEKDYDKIRWYSMEKMMEAFGFDHH